MNIFAERLSKILYEKKLEQQELADALEVSNRAISAYVTGKSFPSMEKFSKMVDYLDVSADYLMGFSDDPKGIRLEEEDDPLLEDVLVIRRAYRNMSTRERKIVIQLIQGIAGEMGDNS